MVSIRTLESDEKPSGIGVYLGQGAETLEVTAKLGDVARAIGALGESLVGTQKRTAHNLITSYLLNEVLAS